MHTLDVITAVIARAKSLELTACVSRCEFIWCLSLLGVVLMVCGAVASGGPAAGGVLLGVGVAAPIGPVGLACIRRTLAAGQLTGFVTGLGAATAHGLLGSLAGGSLHTVFGLLAGDPAWLRLAGGLVLCMLGLRALRSGAQVAIENRSARGLLAAYSSTLWMPWINPMSLFSVSAFLSVQVSPPLALVRQPQPASGSVCLRFGAVVVCSQQHGRDATHATDERAH